MARAVAVLAAALLVGSVVAQSPSTAPADAPIAFAPTTTAGSARAPSPAASRQRSGTYASDSLATTPTSYNQIQTIGTYSSAHVAPPAAIRTYLNTSAAQSALPEEDFVPQSTAFTSPEIYDQLETYGVRQFHFPIYYDPMGGRYQTNAGLKIVNASSNLTAFNDKWSYPGWKVMSEPNFDFNTSCVTLSTCLYNIKNWLLSTSSFVPLTIYLEPMDYTYTSESGDNTTFAAALAASNRTEGPDTLADPIDIETYPVTFQPWRDLENEIGMVFDYDQYYAVYSPQNLTNNTETVQDLVFQPGYQLYPSLEVLNHRVLFVLTGDYVQNYLEYAPDLANATLFVAEPYSESGNYTSSTLFVDVVGPLEGVDGGTFDSATARAAVTTQAAQVRQAVQAGYMVRASADWNTVEPRNNYTTRAQQVLAAGAHFVQTSFPVQPTLFSSGYSVALPVRGNVQQSTRCNPITSGGVIFNATALYTTGCPAVNSLTPAQAPTASA